MTFVTFQADIASVPFLPAMTVLVYTASPRTLVMHQSAGPASIGYHVGIYELPPGEYVVTARADGFRFPFDHPITVPAVDPEDEGGTYSLPLMFLIPGTPSTASPEVETCRVHGWVQMPSPNSSPGLQRELLGQQATSGANLGSTTLARAVVFRKLSDSLDGGNGAVVDRGTTRVSFDRNGYFEAVLDAEAWYSVFIPNVGTRRIRTPEAGVDAEMSTLIQSSSSTPFNEIR